MKLQQLCNILSLIALLTEFKYLAIIRMVLVLLHIAIKKYYTEESPS